MSWAKSKEANRVLAQLDDELALVVEPLVAEATADIARDWPAPSAELSNASRPRIAADQIALWRKNGRKGTPSPAQQRAFFDSYKPMVRESDQKKRYAKRPPSADSWSWRRIAGKNLWVIQNPTKGIIYFKSSFIGERDTGNKFNAVAKIVRPRIRKLRADITRIARAKLG